MDVRREEAYYRSKCKNSTHEEPGENCRSTSKKGQLENVRETREKERMWGERKNHIMELNVRIRSRK